MLVCVCLLYLVRENIYLPMDQPYIIQDVRDNFKALGLRTTPISSVITGTMKRYDFHRWMYSAREQQNCAFTHRPTMSVFPLLPGAL